MKTAEEIIQEYLDRGYGLESLRILAESREEPLGGQMLEILGRLETAAAHEESAMVEVPCETGSFGRADGEALFFVAGDDAAADGESIDFDIMAGTAEEIPETPAGTEESVADIVVDGTADAADCEAEAVEAAESIESVEAVESTVSVGLPETGMWSRLWSRMSQSTPALAPSMAEEMAASMEVAPAEEEEEAVRPFFAESVFAEEPEAEAAESVAEEPAAEEPVAEEAVAEEPIAEEAVAEESVAEEAVAEEPAAEEPIAEEPVTEEPIAEEPIAEEPVVDEPVAETTEPESADSGLSDAPAASAEISADYLPGSVVAPFETDSAADAATEEPAVAETTAEAPAAEDAQPAEQQSENKISRREKRRRERQEKKKAKRDKKHAAAALPEIVLSPSEDSGTLVPEAAEAAEAPEIAETAETAEPEAVDEPAAELEAVAAETEESFASLIAPETLAALSVHSFALAASLVAVSQGELLRAADIIEQDRLMARLIEQNNLEAALENEAGREDGAVHDAVDETVDERAEEEASAAGEQSVENNVILFRGPFSVFTDELNELDESDAIDGIGEAGGSSCLHMLAAPESDVAEEISEETDRFEEFARAEEPAPEEPGRDQPTAFAVDSATEELEAALERETALRRQLEEEYQTRLDVFAARVLEVQTAAAASENRLAEKKAELDARGAVLEEMKKRLESEEEKGRELLRRLDDAAAAARVKDGDFERFNQTHEGLRDEHSRLYAEFEDLRKAYNEVVTDVMPGLQSERDDLAMTVERLCAKERTLKTSLNSSRRRLAAGYILGAAACLMLVTLPVANWLRSGEENRQLAVDHQLFSELRETLDTQVRQNVDAQTRIVELERKITRARDEISRLDGRNKELAGLAAAQQQQASQYAQDIAVFKPDGGSSAGTPTRAMTMALQATVPPGGKLHVNEVMDPAGSIEQLAMANRERNPGPHGIPARADEAQMAQAASSAGAALPVSALVRSDAGSLRPQAGAAAAARPAAVSPAGGAASTVTAKVKKGEGVAQVVYRVLNTRDPEVIAWVIQENKIRSDRRGNPLIQPNQELRLPKDGRIGQAASAAGR